MKDLEFAFAKMISDRMDALETNAFAVEQSADLPADAVRNVIRSKKKEGPSLSRAKAICDALGLEFYFGPPRETGTIEHLMIDGEDFAPVRRSRARVSAGAGAENADDGALELLAFRRDWLQRLDVLPGNALLVTVSGASMEPGLHDGDLALLDTSKKTVRTGQVYALTDLDGSTRVKRIDMLPGTGLILRSDNPQFPAEPRLGEDANRIDILGKVVWWGHTVKE